MLFRPLMPCLAVALLVSAAPTPAVAGESAPAPVTINGAGATFPYPAYSKWFDEYRKVDPSVQFNYQSIGSGGGIRQVTEGTVDFGATDGPMTDKQLADFTQKRGGGVLHFPTALGANVPIYNVAGLSQDLRFTPEALAAIYLGKVTRWNDPAIAQANPGLSLPSDEIVVVHRSDGSGTTYIWADYLAKVSPEWKKTVGVNTSLKWPVGLGGKGNEGVAGLVKSTANSIGYVELVYAVQSGIAYGQVRNAAGKFVRADLASVTAAAAGAVRDLPDDFRVSITNAPGEGAYPIASFTWLLVPERIADPVKRDAIRAFLRWSLKEGQALLAPLGYASLPLEVVAKVERKIDKIQQP